MRVSYGEMSSALRWVSIPASHTAHQPVPISFTHRKPPNPAKILPRSCKKNPQKPTNAPQKSRKKNPTETRPPSPAQRTPRYPPPHPPPRARRDFGIRKDMQYSLPDRFPRVALWDFCLFCVCSPCPWCRFPACIP